MFTRMFRQGNVAAKKTDRENDHQIFMDELFGSKDKQGENQKEKYKSIFEFESINKYKSIHTYDKLNQMTENSVDAVKPSTLEIFFNYGIIGICYLLMLVLLPFSLFVCLKKIKENERMVIYRLGRIIPAEYKPGYCICFPLIDSCKVVTTAQKEFSLPNLQVLTEENAIVDTTTIMRYEIIDAIKLLNSLEDLNGTLKSVARGILVATVSKKDSCMVEKEKSYIVQDIMKEMNDYIAKWGVKLTNIEMTINSIQEDQEGTGEDPALKTISMVFKSLLGGSDSSSSEPSTGPKPESSLNNLPAELMKFIEGLSTPMVLPAGSNMMSFMNMGQHEPEATSIDMVNIQVDGGGGGSENKMSPFKILKMMEPLINESMVKEIQTVYEFHISSTSERGVDEVFYLDLKNLQKGKIGQGNAPFSKTDCVIRISDEDLNELLTDNLKPFTAYMSGRIEIDGDLQDVFKLKKLISSVSKVIASMK